MAPGAYAAEDSIVWHQWEERPLVQRGLVFPSLGECQFAEVGEDGWEREHHHGGNGRGKGMGLEEGDNI